jgi:tetratricopeptide (TPR) repeat protein
LENHQKALEIFIKVSGQDHPDVATSYQNLAVVYRSQKNHVQTKEMATKAYHIFLKKLGPDHPQTQGPKRFLDEQ